MVNRLGRDVPSLSTRSSSVKEGILYGNILVRTFNDRHDCIGVLTRYLISIIGAGTS